MLVPQVLREPVGTIFGHHFDLQTAFSVVFTLGFGLAKFPAVFVMTGQHFYARRLPALATLMAVSMLISNVGVYVFADVPLAQVACVFVGCFFQSWIWGGMFTYLEGRRCGRGSVWGGGGLEGVLCGSGAGRVRHGGGGVRHRFSRPPKVS